MCALRNQSHRLLQEFIEQRDVDERVETESVAHELEASALTSVHSDEVKLYAQAEANDNIIDVVQANLSVAASLSREVSDNAKTINTATLEPLAEHIRAICNDTGYHLYFLDEAQPVHSETSNLGTPAVKIASQASCEAIGPASVPTDNAAASLPTGFVDITTELIEALNPRLGTIVQGHCESGILFTSTYIERQTACIRGAFSAITRPTPIAAVQVTPSGERPGREPGFAGPGRVLVVAEEHFPLSLVVGFPPCPLAEDLPAPILVPPLVSWLSFASGVQWPGPMDGDGGISDFFVTDGGMVEEPPSGASGRAGALGPFDGGVPPAPPPAAVAPLRPPPL